ncbi:MAG: TetR/AcrR family transcriptional regulator [Xanthobacteraceae bacterium]|nr:TetR/AcrR family transcriptional regulator [Xanthobacteraceae bacterium]
MTRQQPAGRRGEILRRAEEQFAEHGYQGASLPAIARAAGLGNAGLLHHFPSKAKLYRAVLEALAGDVTGRVEAGLAGQTDPRARLTRFVDLQIDWIRARPHGFRVIQRELLDNAERVAAAQVLPLRGYLLLGLDLIEAAQRAGVARRDVPAIALLCIILGTLSYAASVRPTLAQALGPAAGEPAEQWAALIGEAVLRMVGPGTDATA